MSIFSFATQKGSHYYPQIDKSFTHFTSCWLFASHNIGTLKKLGPNYSPISFGNDWYAVWHISCGLPYDDVIKWKHFPRYWPFVWGIHRSPVNSPPKGQWRGALIFSLICAWTNGWSNTRDDGDLRGHRADYDVTVMNRSFVIMVSRCKTSGNDLKGLWDTSGHHIVMYNLASNYPTHLFLWKMSLLFIWISSLSSPTGKSVKKCK